MNWNPFKRKTVPTWDGQHNQLRSIAKRTWRFGSGADDHISGWVWWCTCGESNEYAHHRLFTEEEAIKAFCEHVRVAP
jgi:hypothetical protein